VEGPPGEKTVLGHFPKTVVRPCAYSTKHSLRKHLPPLLTRVQTRPLTFMTCVENWRDVDRLIKADVVACFSSIDHQTRYLLIN
jgi:hypothetical protein